MDYELHCGDCLDILPTLAAGSVDAVIADPPYMINTKSDGGGKLSPWADRVNGAFWYAQWIRECYRLLPDTGCLWTFLNWRSFVTFQKAADDARWAIESVLVWDKDWIGPGGVRGLRPAYELVALLAKPDFAIKNRGLRDIQCFPWSSTKPNGHPAEKPVRLMQWLVRHATPTSGVVLDPFMGSGTTGVACQLEGRRFVGVELDPQYFAIAERRIANARPPLLLPDAPAIPAPEQSAMFGD